MIQIIPLSAVPSQSLTIQLGGQNCSINVYQKSTGLFFDLAIDDVPCVTSVLCLNQVGLIREAYYGFVGQLGFYDTQSSDDPTYDGLGNRYQLLYQTP
jgi:hypothetical protein